MGTGPVACTLKTLLHATTSSSSFLLEQYGQRVSLPSQLFSSCHLCLFTGHWEQIKLNESEKAELEMSASRRPLQSRTPAYSILKPFSSEFSAVVSSFVSWYFEPSQVQRITSGLEANVNPPPMYSAQVMKPQNSSKSTKLVLTHM